jgi:hypothetical protein
MTSLGVVGIRNPASNEMPHRRNRQVSVPNMKCLLLCDENSDLQVTLVVSG